MHGGHAAAACALSLTLKLSPGLLQVVDDSCDDMVLQEARAWRSPSLCHP